MAMSKSIVPVPGSERELLPGTRVVGSADPHERIEVTVRVRPNGESSKPAVSDTLASIQSGEQTHLTRKEFEAAHGASHDDLVAVQKFAHEHGLGVVEVSPARRSVVLSGSAGAMSAAFGVTLEKHETPHGMFRGRKGSLFVPAELGPIVEGVFGLDDRPAARPKLRRLKGRPNTLATRDAVPLSPQQVASLYNFPSGFNGSGQCIGIIELGGGFVQADLDTYFGQLGLPTPQVIAVSVDGGLNQPDGNPNGPDGEVMLDIEVAGAVAPGAKIVVYFAPNTDRGYLDAITTAVHDSTNNPSVISTSWGSPEVRWTDQAIQQMDQAFQAAAAMGVTFCAAAGDQGSFDMDSQDPDFDGHDHVDFPASDPFVLGCGGTRLETSNGAIDSETVWNDGPESATGGGISDNFDPPSYQSGAGVPPSANPGGRVGRGVPDVCGDASPATGYFVRVDGINTVIGGTSAVAPLWAGLVALLNQALGKNVGFLNPSLYSLNGTPAFRDITSGSNGDYSAGPGWDPCTGLGSPNGGAILQALSSQSGAGKAQSTEKSTRKAAHDAQDSEWKIPKVARVKQRDGRHANPTADRVLS
jgi:kumamolisin